MRTNFGIIPLLFEFSKIILFYLGHVFSHLSFLLILIENVTIPNLSIYPISI